MAEDAARVRTGVYRRRSRECKCVKDEEEEDGHSERGLCTPVVNEANLVRQAEGYEISDANKGKHDSQEGQRGRLRVEGAGEGHAHSLAQHPHQRLVGDGDGAREEEVAQGDMK